MPYSPIELSGPGVRVHPAGKQLQVAMPHGGIGAGSICMSGYGGLINFSVMNRPELAHRETYLRREPSAFGILHLKDDSKTTRLLEGPIPREQLFYQGLHSQGYRRAGYEGYPRFRECEFRGAFPFSQVCLSDAIMPVQATVTAWSPFVPLDDKNTSLPTLCLEYALTNTSDARVEAEFTFHMSHLAQSWEGKDDGLNHGLDGRGVRFDSTRAKQDGSFGSSAFILPNGANRLKAMWHRGGWFDGMTMLWEEVSNGAFQANDGADAPRSKGGNGGSALVDVSLEPGETLVIPVVIGWHFPNAHLRLGHAEEPDQKQEVLHCCCDDDACAEPGWSPYYAAHWSDAEAVVRYVESRYASLRERTLGFQQALFRSTLPAETIDAVSANLGILTSPTVLRQANGQVWAWEGCFPDSGCCPGSCTHVWNYAQAMPHLFPPLERSLREQEWRYSMNNDGHVTFRAAIPDGPTKHDYHAAADGQFGGILKLHRDWQISGDDTWLKALLPKARRALEYGIATWDADETGLLNAPHHNTFDIEFWGPDSLCTTIYIGALCAMAEILEYLGDPESATRYRELAQKANHQLETVLFNGEFYEQKLHFDPDFWRADAYQNESPDTLKILQAEGPKYQIGKGCLTDGVVGANWAQLYGIDTPMNPQSIQRALRSIHRHNFKTDLSAHPIPQRPGYAMGSEGGVLNCTWPLGDKPSLPFVYSDEVWPGSEYQAATHMIQQGMIEEGLEIVRTIRSRFDGVARNPWDEYECGSFYARSMSSYALLQVLSGFRYSAVEQSLSLKPYTSNRPFRCFFSTASGYGEVILEESKLCIELLEGELAVKTVKLDGRSLTANVTATPDAPLSLPL
ncbi:GH116 family glycosyl hydrolase [Cerasicoccus frondis]|uniref:GH116 family glycosyl hydrolase n=1 Tax=Cerasicoccus frondis TaxID=490090 RepID=UPI002852A353|nr:GH116 family glycosyl hydrolase [Cerasicoccus frondis]